MELRSIQCSRLQPQSPSRYGSGTGSIPFPQEPAGTRRILGGWRRSGWLWCCGTSCWWCSRRIIKRSSPAGSRRGVGSERRVQSRSTPSEAKPGSLWACGPAPSSVATPRACHRPPDCTRGSPHSSVHPGTLWCWLSSRLIKLSWLMLNWIVRNRTVHSFNCVYLQNMFTNHIFIIYVNRIWY